MSKRPPRSPSVLRGEIGDAGSVNRFGGRLHLQVEEQRSRQRAGRADSVCTAPNPANPPFIPSPASASRSLARADHGASSHTNEGHLGVGVASARRATGGGLTVSPRLHRSLVRFFTLFPASFLTFIAPHLLPLFPVSVPERFRWDFNR